MKSIDADGAVVTAAAVVDAEVVVDELLVKALSVLITISWRPWLVATSIGPKHAERN